MPDTTTVYCACGKGFEVFSQIAAHIQTLTCLECQKKILGQILSWPMDFHDLNYQAISKTQKRSSKEG